MLRRGLNTKVQPCPSSPNRQQPRFHVPLAIVQSAFIVDVPDSLYATAHTAELFSTLIAEIKDRQTLTHIFIQHMCSKFLPVVTQILIQNWLVTKVADGSHVKPLGTCILRVTMQNQTQPFEFTVMRKCSHGVVLGWDFLKASQAVIDCGRKKLTFDEMTFESLHPNRLDVFTVEDCLIPARSMAKIRISSPRVTENNVDVHRRKQ
ncbi:hypothetical protein AVEN_221897-1 [Araneus ventricosus]|uniref:Uncharacterized protein n=1 Tax=Araneus ventricosus TaxID=182803 RepID=A0A4Y2LNZ9_ARAVE|nr:hypothetical protein AVEN_221897-1 [Araneus ventricosus]